MSNNNNPSYRTVQEVSVRERQIKVCRICNKPIPPAVENRDTYRFGGSIAGSLSGSMAASSVAAGATMMVFPPAAFVVGLGGAIAGALAGSQGGAMVSDAVCDTIESQAEDTCIECTEKENRRKNFESQGRRLDGTVAGPNGTNDSSSSSSWSNWGGGLLGNTSGDSNNANSNQDGQSTGYRLGSTSDSSLQLTSPSNPNAPYKGNSSLYAGKGQDRSPNSNRNSNVRELRGQTSPVDSNVGPGPGTQSPQRNSRNPNRTQSNAASSQPCPIREEQEESSWYDVSGWFSSSAAPSEAANTTGAANPNRSNRPSSSRGRRSNATGGSPSNNNNSAGAAAARPVASNTNNVINGTSSSNTATMTAGSAAAHGPSNVIATSSSGTNSFNVFGGQGHRLGD